MLHWSSLPATLLQSISYTQPGSSTTGNSTEMAQSLRWQRVTACTIEFDALDKELLILVGYSLFYIAVGFLVGWTIQRYPLPLLGATQFNQDFWYSVVYKFVLLLLVPSFLYFGLWGYRWDDLRLGSRLSLKTIVAAAVMVTLGFLLNASHLKAIEQNYNVVSFPSIRLAIGVMMALLTAAIPEELFFRGMLQTRLEKKFTPLLAILISSLLFTAWHLPTRYMLSQGVEGKSRGLGSGCTAHRGAGLCRGRGLRHPLVPLQEHCLIDRNSLGN